MNRSATFFVALALAAGGFLGSVTLADGPSAPTVEAKRYRVWWVDSALDLVHGAGRWVEEIFLPGSKVAVQVDFESTPPEDLRLGAPLEVVPRPRAHTVASEKPRNDRTGMHPPSAIEDARIPADLAQRIADLADLTRRVREEEVRLGAEIERQLGMRPLR